MQQKIIKLLNNFAIFPCKENSKIPNTPHGFKDGKKNVDVTTLTSNGFNVGVSCQLSNIIVLDCDIDSERGLNGIETIKNLEKELGKLPITLKQRTQRGGLHLIFNDEGVVHPIGKIGNDVDVKWKGYIVVEPSTIDGRKYEFLNIDKEDEIIIAKLPQKWLDYINKPQKPDKKPTNKNGEKSDNGNFDKMLNGCKFLQHCTKNASTLSEPLWYNFACVLSKLENGEELFDNYSKPYAEYNFFATKNKFENAKNYNVTCDTIKGFFKGCEDCHKSKNVSSPLDLAKETINDLFNENKDAINALTFLSIHEINFEDSKYSLPRQNQFLYQQWNKTYLVYKSKNKLKIKLVANFVVTDVMECTKVFNDKSNRPNLKYYVVEMKNENGLIEKDVEVINNSKSDHKLFQASLDNLYNGFSINMQEATFKTFVAEFISPKVASTLIQYTNAGVIADGKILYENALATPNEIIRADNRGYIKVGDNSYIKLCEAKHYLPKLAKSKKKGKEIAKELILNLKETWGENIVIPMVVLGHMVMALYYDEFIKHYGAPTLILYGETGTGKSTLVTVGLSIFGLSSDAMTSGASTAKSNEYFCSKYNNMNVCIDDVKGETLSSSNFIALIKGIYKGIPRTKMGAYGREVEYIHTCSPLAYSTNEPLPNLKEVFNRINLVEIFGKVFQAEKFNYHELDKTNLQELSLILPEILKFSKKQVVKLYEIVFNKIKNVVPETQRRNYNNIAFAYTGALLLISVSGVKIEDLNVKFIEFAKKQIENYEEIKTPVDKLLDEILILQNVGIIKYDTHFRVIKRDINGETKYQLCFNQGVILSLINKYYSGDKNKIINEQTFLRYAKNHDRFITNKSTTRLGDKKKIMNTITFDVSDIKEYVNLGDCS